MLPIQYVYLPRHQVTIIFVEHNMVQIFSPLSLTTTYSSSHSHPHTLFAQSQKNMCQGYDVTVIQCLSTDEIFVISSSHGASSPTTHTRYLQYEYLPNPSHTFCNLNANVNNRCFLTLSAATTSVKCFRVPRNPSADLFFTFSFKQKRITIAKMLFTISM